MTEIQLASLFYFHSNNIIMRMSVLKSVMIRHHYRTRMKSLYCWHQHLNLGFVIAWCLFLDKIPGLLTSQILTRETT